MFQNKGNRYLTKSVQAIPLSIQLALWQLIDVSVEQGVQLDYFQIFDLTYEEGTTKQVICQRQEIPERSTTLAIDLITLGLEKGLNQKIWVIDDGPHQTMLLPEDY